MTEVAHRRELVHTPPGPTWNRAGIRVHLYWAAHPTAARMRGSRVGGEEAGGGTLWANGFVREMRSVLYQCKAAASLFSYCGLQLVGPDPPPARSSSVPSSSWKLHPFNAAGLTPSHWDSGVIRANHTTKRAAAHLHRPFLLLVTHIAPACGRIRARAARVVLA